jgi:hypothetical protein
MGVFASPEVVMIRKDYPNNGHSSSVQVTFIVPSSIWADHIHLVGDFNDWSYDAHPMQRDRNGDWVLTLALPVSRTYRFAYLCDGEHWMAENHADGYVCDGDAGRCNCVLSTEPSILVEIRQKSLLPVA